MSVRSFCEYHHKARYHTLLYSEPSSGRTGNGDNSTGAKDLYEILGAKPTASQHELRQKYTALARQLHPDSGHEKASASSFSELAAAWNVLSDSKQKLRYDRSLKANEFTESVARGLEIGIRNAVPFLRKTATNVEASSKTILNTTLAAAETTSKTMQDVSEQLERTRERLALEQKSRELQQRSAREGTRAAQLEVERDAIVSGDASARVAELRQSENKMTASQALRILEMLGESSVAKVKSNLSDDIQTLDSLEQKNIEKTKAQQERERSYQAAVRQQEEAILRENRAQQKLEEAKRELEAARKNLATTKQDEAKAAQEEKRAIMDADFAQKAVERQQEAVRTKLGRKEEEVLKRKAQDLKDEASQSMKLSRTLEAEANFLRKEIDAAIQREKERK